MANGTGPTHQVVANIQQGVNVDASFKVLFDRYYRGIVGFFSSRGFSQEDSRDLAQETFFRAFKSIHDLESPASFEPWLLSIAKRTYANEVRHRLAAKRRIDREAISMEDMPIETVSAAKQTGPTIHDALVSQEQVREVERGVEKLPPQARRCILMWAQGYKYREIAATLGISIGTVKSHISTARKQLKGADASGERE